jgi:hypothetical protein
MSAGPAGPDLDGTITAKERWFGDGPLLRLVFLVLLGGAGATLWLDYNSLSEQASLVPEVGLRPVLPAIDRPEIDPNAPRFRPDQLVTTDREVLGGALRITLGAAGVLELTGTINVGAAARFEAEIGSRGEYINEISISSPGGSVNDALEISRQIRARGYDVRVADGALCASSCPLILAGGENRIVGEDAVIGVHQVFGDAASLPGAAQAMSDAQVTTARITRHLESMGISPQLWINAMETPPDRLFYLTNDELVDFGLATEIVLHKPV